VKNYQARTVPVPKELCRALSASQRGLSWVCLSPGSKQWGLDALGRYASATFGKTGLRGGLHLLRHTYASHLVMAGVDLASVQRLLGHSSITTTMIYAHLSQEHLRQQVAKLEY